MNSIGYACICLSLGKNGCVNRGIKSATFKREGLHKCGELALLNVQSLYRVLAWNHANGIRIYRMSSSMFPWLTHYPNGPQDLPQWNDISYVLQRCGKFAIEHGMRLSFHPGQFCVLGGERDSVANISLLEIDRHAQIMDVMGLPQTREHHINIHVNSGKPDKATVVSKWCKNFARLSASAKARLTVENEDKPKLFAVEELIPIHEQTGCAIVFDNLHWQCHHLPDTTLQSSMHKAFSTWNTTPLMHWSSTRKKEDATSPMRAHADWVYDTVDSFGIAADVEFEAKQKELAVKKYLENHT